VRLLFHLRRRRNALTTHFNPYWDEKIFLSIPAIAGLIALISA
jgi:hypothetical protein